MNQETDIYRAYPFMETDIQVVPSPAFAASKRKQAEQALGGVARRGRGAVTSAAATLATQLGVEVFTATLTELSNSGHWRALPTGEVDQIRQDLRRWLRARVARGKMADPAPPVTLLEGGARQKPLSLKEGRARLATMHDVEPVDSWAGPVRKPSQIVAELGIARSTLDTWRTRGEVIAFRAGKLKHVFPLEQFVHGQPVPGIAALRKLVADDRTLWLWLKTRSPQLKGEFPLDCLKERDVTSVLSACQEIFDAA